MNSDDAWEQWGRSDPYFGVLTNERFRRANLDEAARREFFESGRHDVKRALEGCRRYLDPDFRPSRVLDFGCGVGRLVVSFARVADEVVGLDVSDAMLAEAQRNCLEFGLDNVVLQKSDDTLSALDSSFDLIHSVIVFQHVPVERGRRIFAHLLEHLQPGGAGVVHFLYAKQDLAEDFGWRPEAAARSEDPTAPTRPPGDTPEMQMNPYPVNHLLFLLQSLGVGEVHVEFTDHGGMLGVILFFRNPS